MSKRRKAGRTTALSTFLVGLLAAATLSAPSASAADYYWVWSRAYGNHPEGAGSASFKPHGEIFSLYDNDPDGYGVWVRWKIRNQFGTFQKPSIHYGGGAYTYRDFNRSVQEGFEVLFSVCLVDRVSGTYIIQANSCSGYRKVIA